MSPQKAAAPDYGLDAPGVVRNLLLAGGTGLLLWASVALGLWAGIARLHLGGVEIRFPLGPIGLTTGISFTATGLWMIWSSKVGKIRERETLLDLVAWTGQETVLDVGCGRGLMLVGAARRLRSGKATGIDIWQAVDLSGNRPEAALANARAEGVADRVEVRTADMREIPFPDGAFDVVVSCAAIHNLYAAADRAKAIGEIARVLKAGGSAVIDDIRHGGEYAAAFARGGCEVRRAGSRIGALLATIVTVGSLRPVQLVARKAGAGASPGPGSARGR